jgi:glycosyltransferase involved in cell wall biosynthesis
MAPLLSCLIPAYNHAAYVQEAVRSVLDDAGADVEVIAVDDRSTDPTYDVLVGIATREPRLAVMRNDTNQGAAATLARALSAARGKYVTVLASDDRSVSGRLTRQLEVMETGAAWSFGQAHVIDAYGTRTSTEPQGPPPDPDGMLRTLLRGQAIYAPTLMYRRDLLDEVGGVVEAMWEDLATTLRFAAISEPVFLPEPLIEYRVHGQNLHLDVLKARRHVAAHRQAVQLLLEWDGLPASHRKTALDHAAAWDVLAALSDHRRPTLGGASRTALNGVVRRQAKDLLRDIDPARLRSFEIQLRMRGAHDAARAIAELRGPLLLRAVRKARRAATVRR